MTQTDLHLKREIETELAWTGHASSWQSIEDAANAAWAAPGVTHVVDQVKMQMAL